MMIVKYLFSSPDGDIPAGPDQLASPFKIAPSKDHPHLCLKDYFEAIRDFVLGDNGGPPVTPLEERPFPNQDCDDIHQLLIRSEKHGALYHIASVEIISPNRSTKLAVSTALSERGKALLHNEYDLLSSLDTKFHLPYLPRPYELREVTCLINKREVTLLMLLAEWFEDYHEWHLQGDEEDRIREVSVWDHKNGYWVASPEERDELFRQVAKTLTLYYDLQDYTQISAWHHGAGDFIVKREEGKIHTRLTTVRKYEETMRLLSDDAVNPMVAIVYFFLNLTIKIRLDRLEGVGKMVWADEFSVKAAIEGFFEAIYSMERENRFYLGPVDDLLTLLRTFHPEDLHKIFDSLLLLYQHEDADKGDLDTIRENLDTHVGQVYKALQDFRR